MLTPRDSHPWPERHPPDGLVAAYAGGALAPALGYVVEAHLALCPDCADGARAVEEAGGALLDALDPVPMADGALEAVLARLAASDPAAPPDRDVPAELKGLPERLTGPIAEALKTQGWRFMGRGARGLDLAPAFPSLDVAGGASLALYRIEGGAAVPRHSHKGGELTVVLHGAFVDQTGRYGPGDVALGSPRITHRPRAELGATCYALGFTDAPLRLSGALGFIQRALGG